MVEVTVFIEGGGNRKDLRSKCREGFTKFISRAGFQGNMPRVRPCGTRNDAYKAFQIALRNQEETYLLVDSEGAINSKHQQGDPETWKPWEHLEASDKWERSEKAKDMRCHLMVQMTESWFLADADALRQYYGVDLNLKGLPRVGQCIESIEKKHDIKTSVTVEAELADASTQQNPKLLKDETPFDGQVIKKQCAHSWNLNCVFRRWLANFQGNLPFSSCSMAAFSPKNGC